jgi:C4-dicarboxylate transporter DctM subunit
MAQIVILVFGVMVTLMLVNMPIGFVLVACTLAGILAAGNIPIMVLAQRLFMGLDSFTLIAIPLFIMTGQFMAMGGVTKDLLNLSKVVVGRLRGGLAHVNIVSSMIFAGITGSAATDTSSVGSIIVPAMIDEGYKKDFTVAVTAVSSTIGILIPPSIPMILYGVAGNVSIGKLFMGGVIPGIMVGLAQMGVVALHAKKYIFPRSEKMTLKEKLVISVKSIPAVFTVVIIIGGVISGFFTPTESAGVATVYTFLLGVFYYKELYIKKIPLIITEVALTMGMVALMIASASSLGWVLTSISFPKALANAILSVTNNKLVVLLLVDALMLFVGTWMDITPAMIVFAPILLPLATAFNIDLVHFGIVIIMNLAIGLFTPPVGLCTFIACSIAKIQMADAIKALIPFFFAIFIILLLVTYIPPIVMFLPGVFFGK